MEGKIFTPEETTKILSHIAQNMVTKTDLFEAETRIKTELRAELRKEIRQSEQRTMDYTDKRIGEAEGKIMGPFPKAAK